MLCRERPVASSSWPGAAKIMPIEAARPLAFHSPLGADVLLVRRLSGFEQLGRPFQYDLELLSEKHDLPLEGVLGHAACVRLDTGGGKQRFFSGVVVDFALSGALGRYHRYTAVLRPWLWLLTRTQNCRVFQNLTVPQIIKQVLREHGFPDITDRLYSSYAPKEYCIQYRESDFNFLCRLMEDAGIYYYFTHALETHTLVLADDRSSHEPAPGFEEVPFGRVDSDDPDAIGQFFDWHLRRQLQPGKFVLRDYDFQKPAVDLSALCADPNPHAAAECEVYDHPGGFTELAAGERLARLRMEELNAQHESARGNTNVRGLGAGALFELTDHPRTDQNRQYLVVSARYLIDGGGFESGDSAGVGYSASLSNTPANVAFRPERISARPRIPGPQTAIVVGPAGAEIWTDPEGYGRVRVQFPWDREGKRNEESSCWVRVAQAWAGLGWGSMHLPHVGDEVVVSFLEGDPDRPLITGRVYNAGSMPWKPLPAQQTTSYFRDVGENHFSMTEGTNLELFTPKGKTRFDMGTAPEGDGFFFKTDLDYKREIKGEETVDIVGDSTWNIHSSSFVYIDASLTQEVKQDETKKVWGAKYEEIVGPVDIKLCHVTAKTTLGSSTDIYAGHKHSSFFGAETQFSYSEKFGKNYRKKKEKTEATVTVESGQKYTIKSANTSTAELDEHGIKLSAGGTKIFVSKDGAVLITAKGQVVISSKTTAKVLADSGIVIKAPRVTATKGMFESKNIKDLG